MTSEPIRGRWLGIDYGTVRIGLAVTDRDHLIASPLSIRQRRSAGEDQAYFRELCRSEGIGLLVIGLPTRADGSDSAKSLEVRRFAAELSTALTLPVVFADERFSTAAAESMMWDAGLTHKKRKDRRDAVAAQIMLQAYVDAVRAGGAEDPTRPLS